MEVLVAINVKYRGEPGWIAARLSPRLFNSNKELIPGGSIKISKDGIIKTAKYQDLELDIEQPVIAKTTGTAN